MLYSQCCFIGNAKCHWDLEGVCTLMLCCHILNNLLNGGLHFHFALGPTNHAVSSHLQIRQMKQMQLGRTG